MTYHQGRRLCDEDPEAGPGPSTSRYYSQPGTAPHVSDGRKSTSTSPSDDNSRLAYSDEEFIINAITRPTPNDDHQAPAVQPVEQELAPHVALFFSLDSSQGTDSQTPQQHGRRLGQREQDLRWRDEVLPEIMLYKPYSHTGGEDQPAEMAPPPSRRRAISLDTFDGSAADPQWPRNVPAVRVHQPPYPPPERMPTPPGLPSFGTPEAMAASAQFLRKPGSSRCQRASSPSDAIRRLFGILPPAQPTPPPSPPLAPGIQSARGIGRAPDGTMVSGRFGYRQSGHGTSLVQGLDDHAFHINTPPPPRAQNSPVDSSRTSDGARTETASFKSALSLPKRYARLYRPSIAKMFASSSPEPESPNSEPAMAPPPRNPARILGQQRQDPGQNGSPRASPSTSRTESLIRGVQPRENSPLSQPFQTHAVANQTIEEEEPETEPVPQPRAVAGFLSQIPINIPLCCCLGGQVVHENHNGTPLETIASRDTYMTAQSQTSPPRSHSPQHHGGRRLLGQSVSHPWTPVYNFIRRGAAAVNQHIP